MRHSQPIGLVVVAVVLFLKAGPIFAAYPVTVQSCGQPVTFAKAPSRVVSHDMNITEMMFALGLHDRLVGVTGISGWYKMTPEFKRELGTIPELASKYPSLEILLGAKIDFFVAGWYYGMRPGGPVTPESLAEFGIPVYALSESCIHLNRSQAPTGMEILYQDIQNLGKIFDKEAQADELVQSYKARVSAVRGKTHEAYPPTRVFLFDNGEDKPFTAGKHGMPTAIVEAAGGKNIMDDVLTSWGRVGWESVIERNPQFVILVGYADGSWKDRWEFLKTFPPLQGVTAIKQNRYLVLTYTELTPSPRNISAIEKLATALHPDALP